MTPVPALVRVRPGALSGQLRVPGDKSVSHRVLILGALAEGAVHVSGVNPGGDVDGTAGALARMGAALSLRRGDTGLHGTVEGGLREPDDVLDLGNSGTGFRLLAGVAAGLDGLTLMTGDHSLRRRPMGRIGAPLRAMGARVDGRSEGRFPPLAVRGGALRGITHESPVASAQVKSCILLAGLSASEATRVRSPARSRDHTERLLRYLGVDVTTEVDDGGQELVSLVPGALTARPLRVPGDPSAAAFWMVAAAVDGTVTLPGLALNPTRLGVVEALRRLGADVDVSGEDQWCGEPVGTVTVRHKRLEAVSMAGPDVVDAIDELPVLAIAGACSRGGLQVADAAELRVKETDRIEGIAALFSALGLRITTTEDGFAVPGGQQPSGGVFDARGDHRLAMTACVAGSIASGPVEVRSFGPVSTSYPGFAEDFRRLGGNIDVLAVDA